MLGITFRRDSTNFRPRINKLNSVLDKEQKSIGNYFCLEDWSFISNLHHLKSMSTYHHLKIREKNLYLLHHFLLHYLSAFFYEDIQTSQIPLWLDQNLMENVILHLKLSSQWSLSLIILKRLMKIIFFSHLKFFIKIQIFLLNFLKINFKIAIKWEVSWHLTIWWRYYVFSFSNHMIFYRGT